MRAAPAPSVATVHPPGAVAPRRSRRPRTTSGPSAGGSGWSWPSRSRSRRPGTLYVLRMPPVYRSTAVDRDQAAAGRPGRRRARHHGEVGRGDPRPTRNTSPTPLAMLKQQGAGRARSSATPRSGCPPSALDGDPAAELIGQAHRPGRSPSRTSTPSPSRAPTRPGSPGCSTSCSTSSRTKADTESRDGSDTARSRRLGDA